jgi:microcystin-dependent protein
MTAVNPVDQLAETIRSLVQRITSLERAAATPAAAPSGGGNPTGTYITGAWATAPDGYLMMGTSVPNADTAHPDLWAIVPASWKSGTTLNLPDMDDRTLMGGGTLGDVGGSNEATIDAANLPLHLHDMDHNHPAGTTGGQSADHTHTVTGGGEHQHTQRYLTTATGSGSNADLARPGGATFSFTDISNAGDTADGTHWRRQRRAHPQFRRLRLHRSHRSYRFAHPRPVRHDARSSAGQRRDQDVGLASRSWRSRFQSGCRVACIRHGSIATSSKN